MKLFPSVAVAIASVAIVQDTIPVQGLAVWSTKVGNHYKWYYTIQVLLMPDHKYRVVWVHRSGHVGPSYGDHEFLEDALVEVINGLRDYYQADADYREDAARFYYQELLKCA